MKRRGKKGERPGVPLKDDDDIIVVCLPAYVADVIPGSTQRNCRRCAEPIWVSPATLRSFDDNPRRYFICMDCAVKDKELKQSIQPPTKEQLEELKNYIEKMDPPEKEKEQNP